MKWVGIQVIKQKNEEDNDKSHEVKLYSMKIEIIFLVYGSFDRLQHVVK